MNAFYYFMASSAASETGEHAVEQTAEHGSGVFPPLDASTFSSQLFWLFITFGLLLLFLAKVLLPRVGSILEDRSNRIADDLDGAARMTREAEAAELSYEKSLKDARAKAHNVAETTRASVNAELEAEMDAADEMAAKALEAAETKIRKLRTNALANVDEIASETAKSLVEKLFTGKITAIAARKAVKAQG